MIPSLTQAVRFRRLFLFGTTLLRLFSLRIPHQLHNRKVSSLMIPYQYKHFIMIF